MARGIRFKVFEGSNGFYFHVIAGNNEITLPSQRYGTAAHAHRATRQVWRGFAVATVSQYAALTGPLFFARCPVPYTRDSLKPSKKK